MAKINIMEDKDFEQSYLVLCTHLPKNIAYHPGKKQFLFPCFAVSKSQTQNY